MQSFNYHSHTYRCKHSEQTYMDEEYVQDYIKAGFKKVAFTDHCPEKNMIDKRPNMRMDYDERLEYYDSIKNLQKKYAGQIEIKSGFEIEYLPGEEENLRELKNETDIIVLGQHFIYDDNKNLKIIKPIIPLTKKELLRYADYIKTAIELGLPDIVVHPDLFMLSRVSFGDTEREVANIICEAAEKHNVILEINLNNIFKFTYHEDNKINNLPIEKQKKKLKHVRYPWKDFWEVVAEHNIKVVYGLDTHYRGQIPVFNELVSLANEILGEDLVKKLNFVEE